MQFYIVPALLMLFGATHIHGVSASSSNNLRRHLLPGGADADADATHFMECVLYLKVVDYVNGDEKKSWSCEFTIEQAATFGGVDMMDIEGLTLEAIEAKGAISGETIIRVKSAYVEQSKSKTVLQIPQDSDFEVEKMEETDVRRAHNRRARRQRHRNLAETTGTRKVLVVRVIDKTGIAMDQDAVQLEDDIFSDAVSLKTQYAACSHDQLILEPATEFGTDVAGVFINGIVDVTVDATATNGLSTTFEDLAVAKVTTDYGGGNSLGDTYDLVLYCLPPGTVSDTGKSWLAYAYANRWDSYYNSDMDSCSNIADTMHETGHNFNLDHSGIKGDGEYTDHSGMMGGSPGGDDTPKQCFNAAKSFQLGWYPTQIKSYNPLDYVSNPQSFVMNGVADYEKDGSNGLALVSLRLENEGLEGGVDYYIGYNRAFGANIGTDAVPNTVTVHEKENLEDPTTRDGFGQSWRLAAMEAGQYKIQNYGGSIIDVFVTVDSIDGKEASITISTSSDTTLTLPPTEPPTKTPTKTPTLPPTTPPTEPPTSDQTTLPPTKTPTKTPTLPPTTPPTEPPTSDQTTLPPTKTPTKTPTLPPTTPPTEPPTSDQTTLPPTKTPTKSPTLPPTTPPTKSPSNSPSNSPTSFKETTIPPTTTPGPCTNSNGTVKINKNRTTTCNKLKNKHSKKKRKFCKINAVFNACPGECNSKCTCKDNFSFKLNGERKKYKCKNVGEDRQPGCSGTVKTNTLVEDVCPNKCGVCF